jgi:hypothetical protein
MKGLLPGIKNTGFQNFLANWMFLAVFARSFRKKNVQCPIIQQFLFKLETDYPEDSYFCSDRRKAPDTIYDQKAFDSELRHY